MKNNAVIMMYYEKIKEESKEKNSIIWDCINTIISKQIEINDKKLNYLANKLIETGIIKENFLNDINIDNEYEEILENLTFIENLLNSDSDIIFTELNDLSTKIQWAEYNGESMLMKLQQEMNEKIQYL